MDCLRRTHKERREHRAAAAVSTATVASVMRGVRVAALLQCGAAAVARPAAGTVLGAACPYAPLDNSYSYAMGVARHLAGEIASLLLLQQAA